MELFNKFENSYYEAFIKLINDSYDNPDALYSKKQIADYISDNMDIKLDRFLLDELINEDIEDNCIFEYDDDKKKYKLVIENTKMPVILNKIEIEALKNLLRMDITKNFLEETTIDKLKQKIDINKREWSIENIKHKRQFKKGDKENIEYVANNIKLILKALKNQCPICCSYNARNNKRFENEILYPIKIEYSPINDKYRLFCMKVENNLRKYIKMNISSIEDIEILKDNKIEDIELFVEESEKDFLEFQKSNLKELTLYVDPEEHVLERCFRIFSFFNRDARYDSEKDIYILKIEYHCFDEAEVIKNILSIGHRVVVAEPQDIREKIIKRVKEAIDKY